MKSLSPVPGTFGWDNFCSKYDVAGPDVLPDGVKPSVNILVRNEDSVRTDHVTYEYNLRQFVGPIVECIWQGGGNPPRARAQQEQSQETRAMRLGIRRIAYALVLPIVFALLFWSAFTWWTKVLVVEPTWITWLTGDLGVESWAQEHLTNYDEYGLVITYDEDGTIQKTLVDTTEYEDCGADATLRPVPQNADGQHVVVLNPCTSEDDDSLGVNELWEKVLTGAFALLLLIPIGFLIFSIYRNNFWWPKEMELSPAPTPSAATTPSAAPRTKNKIQTFGRVVGRVVLKILQIVLLAVVLLFLVVSVWEAISFLVLDSHSVFDSLKDTLGSTIVWAIVATTFLIAFDFIFEKDRDDPSPYGSSRP
jgi:hypothetical protein